MSSKPSLPITCTLLQLQHVINESVVSHIQTVVNRCVNMETICSNRSPIEYWESRIIARVKRRLLSHVSVGAVDDLDS